MLGARRPPSSKALPSNPIFHEKPQLLWHSPTYGAGQQLLPGPTGPGIPANTLPPTYHGRSLATPEPAYVGLNAPEQRRTQFGQESLHAFDRGPHDRRTVFDLRASSPDSY